MPVTFGELGLSDAVLRAIGDLGYEEPTPVQAQAIPFMMRGEDIIAQAQTGTGKTAAFAIPIMERIEPGSRLVQALVLVPTRELAIQAAEAAYSMGRHRGVSVLPIYGGQAYDRQLRGLRAGAHLVVGTPGRVMDHIRRGTLRLDALRIVVLDEADEMLEMGFAEDIEFILDQTPGSRQTALFSATMPSRIEALARRYLRNPQRISFAREARTVPQTRQVYYETPYRGKLDALTRILDLQAPRSAIIFCRTKREVDELVTSLQARGYSADGIHGDISQAQRERVLRSFRENRVDLLVATDVAARGLDIPEVTHVINYDIPDDADAYIHRIGRTGRMGRKGEALTLVTPREVRQLRFIERQIGKKLKPVQLPTPSDITTRRREAFLETLRETIRSGAGESYAMLAEELAETHDPLAIAAAALHLAFEKDKAGARPPVLAADRTASEPGMTRLLLDAGRGQGIRPRDVVEGLTAEGGIPGSSIGNIDLLDDLTLVDLKPAAATAIKRIGHFTLHGVEVNVEEAGVKERPGRARLQPARR